MSKVFGNHFTASLLASFILVLGNQLQRPLEGSYLAGKQNEQMGQ